MPSHSKTIPNPVFPDEPDFAEPAPNRISRLARMGLVCNVLKLISTLKAPYRCIVRCGYNSMKASWLMMALGIILLYFFGENLFDEGGPKRYFGLLGLVLLTMGVAFFSMGLSICIFYVRLYKAHEKQLHELSVQNYLATPTGTPPPTSPRPPRPPTPKREATAGQIWTIQQNSYPYNVPQPSAPPPPLDTLVEPQPSVYGVHAWDFKSSPTGDASSSHKYGFQYPNK